MKKIIASYLSSLTFRPSLATRKTYEQGIKTYVRAVGANSPFSIETYVKFLKALAGYSPATQDVYRAAVVDLYGYYCDEHGGMINLLAMKRADKRYLKHEKKTEVNFDRESVNKLIQYAINLRSRSANLADQLRDARDRAFILFLVDSGLRISEACSLKRADVPWDTGKMYIVGKGRKKAKIHFSKRALDAIKKYLNARMKIDSASGVLLESLPLFARHDRGAGKKVKPVKPGGMWWAFAQHMERAGLDPRSISPHKLRHEAVTRFYENTHDIKSTMNFSRHSRMDTVNRYTHLVDTVVDDTYDEIFNKESNNATQK